MSGTLSQSPSTATHQKDIMRLETIHHPIHGPIKADARTTMFLPPQILGQLGFLQFLLGIPFGRGGDHRRSRRRTRDRTVLQKQIIVRISEVRIDDDDIRRDRFRGPLEVDPRSPGSGGVCPNVRDGGREVEFRSMGLGDLLQGLYDLQQSSNSHNQPFTFGQDLLALGTQTHLVKSTSRVPNPLNRLCPL